MHVRAAPLLVFAPMAIALACNSLINIDKDYRVGDLPGGGGAGAAGGTGGAGGEPACVDAEDCGQDTTCQQHTCNGTCGVQNAAVGTACSDGSGTVCDGEGNCVPDGCIDGVKSQDETDVDCGGPDCGPCPNGSNCELPGDCASGFCPAQDGLCCDAACDGLCEACTEANTAVTDGTCAFILAGQDPDNECPIVGEACGGSGSCSSCGVEPQPPGGSCPPECTGGCVGSTCNIACAAATECLAATITCPAGFACDVQCTNNRSCEGAIINCPDTYACNVNCTANQSCESITVNCTTGSCSLICGIVNNLCLGATLNCGTDACTAICLGTSTPTVDCTPSCSCITC